MSPWLLIPAKMLAAGVLVALISHLSTALKPKSFAGLFAAAPSVAFASLLLTSFDKPAHVPLDGRGMVAGAVGMIACCLSAALLVPKVRSLGASALGWGAWVVTAGAVFWLLSR